LNAKPGRIYIGTSGWIYKEWSKAFYPRDLPAKGSLQYYAQQFNTVEINASFYRLPTEAAFANWAGLAPSDFLYSVKGSRAVTHFKRLLPGAKSLPILLERSRLLGDHLGPILWQLPGSMKKNMDRLEQFLESLDPAFRYAVEFRDPSWIGPATWDLLRTYQVANVALSSQNMPMCLEVTTDFTYVRFHGLAGGAAHDYTDGELKPWAAFLRGCARRGVAAFVYFNNDVNTRAPLNAQRLRALVGKAAK
jgi:uncharacterized protein YecE (DUF72 family)